MTLNASADRGPKDFELSARIRSFMNSFPGEMSFLFFALDRESPSGIPEIVWVKA